MARRLGQSQSDADALMSPSNGVGNSGSSSSAAPEGVTPVAHSSEHEIVIFLKDGVKASSFEGPVCRTWRYLCPALVVKQWECTIVYRDGERTVRTGISAAAVSFALSDCPDKVLSFARYGKMWIDWGIPAVVFKRLDGWNLPGFMFGMLSFCNPGCVLAPTVTAIPLTLHLPSREYEPELLSEGALAVKGDAKFVPYFKACKGELGLYYKRLPLLSVKYFSNRCVVELVPFPAERFEVPAILTSLRIEKNDEMIIEGPRFPFKKSIRRYVQAAEERFNALLRSYEARLDIRLVLPGKMGV